MLFEKIVSEGLAHNSYLIGSGGKIAVIDPRRDCEIYREIASEHDSTITHIFETHRNEDYVIGSGELKDRTGADIFHGISPLFQYGNPVKEGEKFTFGSLELSVLETPGHTEESISLVLKDREVSDEPYMIFCGDTLFAGDIARTDFYGNERKAEMAGKIYDSISKKILSLGDGVIICPAHGAGSVCGEEIADHPLTTSGYEIKTNILLRNGREAFVAGRVKDSPYYPPYFRTMEGYNARGAPKLPCPLSFRPLTIDAVNKLRHSGCQIVDIRSPTSFAAGHIPGSLSLWRDGLASFMGWFLDYALPIVIVDDFNRDLEPVFLPFIRLGYDNLRGYLAGGFPAWSKGAQDTAMFGTCTPQELEKRMANESLYILDVRDIRNREKAGSIQGSHHCYVGDLPGNLGEIPHDQPVVAYCDGGYKGSLAAGILTSNGYRDVTNLLGGMAGWKHAGYSVER